MEAGIVHALNHTPGLVCCVSNSRILHYEKNWLQAVIPDESTKIRDANKDITVLCQQNVNLQNSLALDKCRGLVKANNFFFHWIIVASYIPLGRSVFPREFRGLGPSHARFLPSVPPPWMSGSLCNCRGYPSLTGTVLILLTNIFTFVLEANILMFG